MDIKGLSAMIGGMADKDIAKERWDICKDCENLTFANTCTECGCFMVAKTKFKKAFCPIDKWGKSE
jgi:rRNA maturation protein Nop10